MKPFGGFLELEIGRGAGPYHRSALALCSGRACLGRILDGLRPTAVHAPAYICDTAIGPMRERGIAVRWYPVTDMLEPAADLSVADGEALLFVNYFGLKTAAARVAAARYGARVIVDDTHAFFERGYPGARSFNSARKFFGVPDGAYAYGEGLQPVDEGMRAGSVRYQHLITRLAGDLDAAYAQYLEHEAAVESAPLRMSALSERLLASIDYDAARETRRANFLGVHDRLRSRNRLPAGLFDLGALVPYCYPLLADGSQPVRDRLWEHRLFVPQFWRDVLEREAPRFSLDACLAERLMPLPIDQRYTLADMDDMCDRLERACQW